MSTPKRCVLIGSPVSHSVSPIMQGAAFQKAGLDITYEGWETPEEEIKETISRLREEDILGANVTIPHKQTVMPFLDRIDETAQKIGAVNTIVKKDGKLIGYNTDWIGVVSALEEKIRLEGKDATIAGAGGAARAVVYGLLQKGANVTVLARDEKKARALGEEFGCDFGALDMLGEKQADILINTTPLGMHPQEDKSIAAAEQLKSVQAVFDLVYNPLRTRLLQEAKSAGCTIVDGLRMLVFQGAASFTLWTSETPDIELMDNAAREELRRRD